MILFFTDIKDYRIYMALLQGYEFLKESVYLICLLSIQNMPHGGILDFGYLILFFLRM